VANGSAGTLANALTRALFSWSDTSTTRPHASRKRDHLRADATVEVVYALVGAPPGGRDRRRSGDLTLFRSDLLSSSLYVQLGGIPEFPGKPLQTGSRLWAPVLCCSALFLIRWGTPGARSFTTLK
jgi:hypothetical protein